MIKGVIFFFILFHENKDEHIYILREISHEIEGT